MVVALMFFTQSAPHRMMQEFARIVKNFHKQDNEPLELPSKSLMILQEGTKKYIDDAISGYNRLKVVGSVDGVQKGIKSFVDVVLPKFEVFTDSSILSFVEAAGEQPKQPEGAAGTGSSSDDSDSSSSDDSDSSSSDSDGSGCSHEEEEKTRKRKKEEKKKDKKRKRKKSSADDDSSENGGAGSLLAGGARGGGSHGRNGGSGGGPIGRDDSSGGSGGGRDRGGDSSRDSDQQQLQQQLQQRAEDLLREMAPVPRDQVGRMWQSVSADVEANGPVAQDGAMSEFEARPFFHRHGVRLIDIPSESHTPTAAWHTATGTCLLTSL